MFLASSTGPNIQEASKCLNEWINEWIIYYYLYNQQQLFKKLKKRWRNKSKRRFHNFNFSVAQAKLWFWMISTYELKFLPFFFFLIGSFQLKMYPWKLMTFLTGFINVLLKKRTSCHIFMKQVHNILLRTFPRLLIVPEVCLRGNNHFFILQIPQRIISIFKSPA